MTAPVIVGVDGGDSGRDALVLGQWTATVLDAPLVVTVVHPAPAALGSGRVDAEWIASRRSAAQAVLDGARAVLTGLGAPAPVPSTATSEDTPGPGPGPGVEYRAVASTSAAHGLHDLAEQLSAQTIVVGSGRAGPRHRLFAGSTADRLLAGSSCPIAVAPAGMQRPPGTLGRIGVAYVDTLDGRAALDTAASLASRTRTPLRLYTVVADSDATLPFLVGQDAEHAFRDTARETYELSLTRAAAAVRETTADWEIRTGDVVDQLAELDDIDVLFCGSRGYGPTRRVLLGGVSTRLVRRARRPVVIVPRSG